MCEAGYTEATLWVLERNDRARAWYERLGWQCTRSSREALRESLDALVAETRAQQSQ